MENPSTFGFCCLWFQCSTALMICIAVVCSGGFQLKCMRISLYLVGSSPLSTYVLKCELHNQLLFFLFTPSFEALCCVLLCCQSTYMCMNEFSFNLVEDKFHSEYYKMDVWLWVVYHGIIPNSFCVLAYSIIILNKSYGSKCIIFIL